MNIPPASAPYSGHLYESCIRIALSHFCNDPRLQDLNEYRHKPNHYEFDGLYKPQHGQLTHSNALSHITECMKKQVENNLSNIEQKPRFQVYKNETSQKQNDNQPQVQSEPQLQLRAGTSTLIIVETKTTLSRSMFDRTIGKVNKLPELLEDLNKKGFYFNSVWIIMIHSSPMKRSYYPANYYDHLLDWKENGFSYSFIGNIEVDSSILYQSLTGMTDRTFDALLTKFTKMERAIGQMLPDYL